MAPEPNDQMIEPEVGNDELTQWLADLEAGNANYDVSHVLPPINKATEGEQVGEHHTITANGETPDDEEPDDEDGDEPTPGAPASEAVAGTDFFEVNGNRFERADIERLYNFDQYLRANPDAAVRVAQALPGPPATGQPPVPETSTETPPPVGDEFKPPEPPDYLDLEDPSQRFQWETHVNTQRQFFERDQADKRRWQEQAQERQSQINRQAVADMDSALSVFKQAHPNLNDDDLATIRKEAVPFVEGMMRTLPPVQALARSMEVAGWANNDLRPKLADQSISTPSNEHRSRKRKQRLGEISGTPRSAPKTESRVSFTSDKDMVNALAHAFAENGLGTNG